MVQLISDAYQSSDVDLVRHELGLLERIAFEVGRPLSFTIQQNDDTPDRHHELFAAIESWNQRGAQVRAQVAARPIGVLIGLTASANPLWWSSTYRSLASLPLDERVDRMSDPAVRAEILAQHAAAPTVGFPALIHRGFDRMYPLDDPIDYEPTAEASIAGLASSAGVDPAQRLYDELLADHGHRLLYLPLMNYARGDLTDLRSMITSPHSIFGLSDAGAHCNAISDGTFPTSAVAHWTRDRTRGERIPLERIVHLQTQATAAHVGWDDRGLLAPGCLADINLVDHDRLRLRPPHVVDDLPAGGTRLLQEAEGYVATYKRGVVIAREGVLTGERPGRLQRGPQPPAP